MPDDASVPVQILYWALTPIRLFRQRTGVQMIVSYVAMAMITAMLLISTLAAAIIWPQIGQWIRLEGVAMDTAMGEQARAYAMWINPDTIGIQINRGLSEAESVELNEDLDTIVAAKVPGFDPPFKESYAFRIAHVAVIDTAGIIVASDDPEWGQPGDTLSEFQLKSTRDVAARSLILDGEVDPSWGTLYSMDLTDERTSAAYPLINSQGDMVGVIVLEGNPIRSVLGGESRIELVQFFAKQFRYVILFMAIPAILVAIPFGLWRSWSISRRLEKMAAAADAMSEGELDTRIPVKQRDEIGRLAERFNQMATTIENNDRIRRAFISNVSHELRTPISIIQGTVERQLEQREDLPTAENGAFALIQRESDMLGRMINDLFTLTRIGEHNLRLDRKIFDLLALSEVAVGGIRDLAWNQSRVSVESLVPPDLPLVYADETRVRQILNNLLYNSLRHTPEGGLVVLQARPKGNMVEISVSDTGLGIPEGDVGHVFDRYFQAERGKRHEDGSGLGLSIVKQLVEAQGGETSVESIVDQGTTFRFTLPQAK